MMVSYEKVMPFSADRREKVLHPPPFFGKLASYKAPTFLDSYRHMLGMRAYQGQTLRPRC
jgi:hypothetical protein